MPVDAAVDIDLPEYLRSVPQSAGPDPLWEQTVRLDRQARWLATKSDDTRRSCRDLLDAVGDDNPLSAAQIADLRSDPPLRTREAVFAEFRRLRDEAAGFPARPAVLTDDDLADRVAALERAVADLTARRTELRRMFLAMCDVYAPFHPLTPEEVAEVLEATARPSGPTIADLIAEIEREARP